ncbi:MAG TPA: hypothetical protein PK458_20410 [Phycisphaerae bacterium]|nr:hypothetical protein [Phycisphaerae bacterium]
MATPGEVAEIKGELRQFQASVDGQLKQFHQDMRMLFQQTKEANDSVIRASASLDAFIDRTRDEMGVLFTTRNEHETRLSRIERDYKPQSACAMEMSKLEQTQGSQGKTIVGLQKTEAKAAGIAAVISVAVGVIARFVWH